MMYGIASSISWMPVIGPSATLVLVALAVVVCRAGWRILRTRFDPVCAAGLMGLRVAVLTLLFLALADPACEHVATERAFRRMVVLTDVSSSMDVRDMASGSRRERADRLRQTWQKNIAGVEWIAYDVDVRLSAVQRPLSAVEGDGLRETDLAAILRAARDDPRVAGADAVVLLTDGGDEMPLPGMDVGAPLLVVGFGSDPSRWRDVALQAIRAPERLRPNAHFVVEADVIARDAGDPVFRAALEAVPIHLVDDAGHSVASRRIDLRDGAALARFDVQAGSEPAMTWRIEVGPVDGELSDLNNHRRFQVHRDRETVNVLYFAMEIGAGFKFLRRALSADASIAFHSLFPISEAVWSLQGDARHWPEMAGARGLPSMDALRRFDALILGSLSDSGWDRSQAETLESYVEQGGGLILLGGEGLSLPVVTATLGGLLPWMSPSGETFVRHPVDLAPPAAAGAPQDFWMALQRELAETGGVPPVLSAYNRVGVLKPGATSWLDVLSPGGRLPLLAVQPYGRGRVFALASNTTWRWAMMPTREKLYHQFWRMLVREAAGQAAQQQGSLRVRLEAARIRVGIAQAFDVEILDAVGDVQLSAFLSSPDGERRIALAPSTDAPGRFRGHVICTQPGPHALRIERVRDGQMESWSRTLEPVPRIEEGARLECDHAALQPWTAAAGGAYFPESQAEAAGRWLAQRRQARVQAVRRPWSAHGPWFAGFVLALWMLECYARRRRNLI